MAKKAHRDYPDNGFPSVTQVLGVLRKIGLEQWFLSNTREYCNRISKAGKEAGTDTHEAIQQFIETGIAKVKSEHAEEVTNALQSFILFRKENPEILLSLSEIPLTHSVYGYNGTIDAPHPPMLSDWKTSKDKLTIYDEYRAQTSAYVHLWNQNNPDKLIDRAYIVALAKDTVAYNLYKMDQKEIDECFYEIFLPALKIFNYQKQSKQIAKERKQNGK